jgi:5-hydroxyisourate hydrolase-like protein (transthyretin family)
MRVSRLIVAALACVSTSLACSDSTSATSAGTVSVQVVDESDAAVSLINVDLYRVLSGGPVLWRTASTSADGRAVFGLTNGGIVPGDYYVHLSFVTNYTFATGETNDKPVTVQAGDDATVTFHVTRVGPRSQ